MMMPQNMNPLLDPTIKVVAAACEVARYVQRDLERVREITKDDRSPVTVADFAVQAVVHLGLAEVESRPVIVGEESAAALRDPSKTAVLEAVVEAVRTYRPGITADEVLAAIDACDHDASADAYWALDPVDGTKGFLRGQQYAIALGRISHDQVTLGVMGCPNLPCEHDAPLDGADPTGMVYFAEQGKGAFSVNGEGTPRRISVAAPSQHAIRVCESVESSHSKQSDTQRIMETLGTAGTPVRLDSQCKYAVVARGQADAYLRLPTKRGYEEKIWDHAAGSIIAVEAGAIVTDILGSPLDFSQGVTLKANHGIICAIPEFHARIISAIDALGIATAEVG